MYCLFMLDYKFAPMFGPTFFKGCVPMFGPTFFKGCVLRHFYKSALNLGEFPDKLHYAFRCTNPVVPVVQSAIKCWTTQVGLDSTAIEAVNIPIINTAQGHFILR